MNFRNVLILTASIAAGDFADPDLGDAPLIVLYYPNYNAILPRDYHAWDIDQSVFGRQMPVRNWVITLSALSIGSDCSLVPTNQQADWSQPDTTNNFFFTGNWYWSPGGTGPAGVWPQFLALKHQKYPYTKLMISIGGRSGSQSFSDCLAWRNGKIEREGHNWLLDSFRDMAFYFGFDGYDFDWEYPNCPGPEGTCGCNKEPICLKSSNIGRDDDWENFIAFLVDLYQLKADMQDTWGKPFYFSLALGANPDFLLGKGVWSKPFPTQELCLDDTSAIFDWINLLAYDYNGPWAPTTAPVSPLYAEEGKPSVASSVQILLDAGCQPEKILIGLAAYGRQWAQVPRTGTIPGLYQNSNQQQLAGDAHLAYSNNGTYELGSVAYWDVKTKYLQTCTRTFDDESKTPTLYCATAPNSQSQAYESWKQNIFVSYEDEESWYHKMRYARSKGLGGAAIWSVENFGTGASGTDVTDVIMQGLFDGWYGKGKVTISRQGGLYGDNKFSGPPKFTHWQQPCPYPTTLDANQERIDSWDTRATYRSFLTHDYVVNNCYNSGGIFQYFWGYAPDLYPYVDGENPPVEFGKDVELIQPVTKSTDYNKDEKY